MNYKKKVTIQFPDAECSFTPHWGWCIYETFDTILPLHRLGCGNNISQAWQDAFNKHCNPSRMPVDDEQPEERVSMYIKTEHTVAHASFTKEPSPETLNAVKAMIDLAYNMPLKPDTESPSDITTF